MLDVIR